MLSLDDFEYSASDRVNSAHGGFNEYYKGHLDNGDILELSHYGYYETRWWWEWAVYTPEDYPISVYQRNYAGHQSATPEECLADFEDCYKGRSFMSRAEADALYGKEYARCLACGWEGESSEVDHVTVYEDYGDVSCAKCPSCGRIEYDGDELFEYEREEQ